MGESACLVRSFSQPAEIRSSEINEGDPIRCLTESVSFGRFTSESLAWEKFSAFSHNRYLEEVERFAKPGTVAQRKAFFEAHFKNRAAMKVEQTKLEETSVATIESLESQEDNPIESHAPMVIDISTEAEIFTAEKACSSISEMAVTDEVKDNSMKTFEANVPGDNTLNEVNPSSTSKERFRLTPSHKRTEKDTNSSSEKSISVTKKQKRLSAHESFLSSINNASTCVKSNKESPQMPRKSPGNSTGHKAQVEADKTKKSIPISVETEQKAPIRSSSTTRVTTSSNITNTLGRRSARAADKNKRLVPSSAHSPRKKIPVRSSTRREITSSKAKTSPRISICAKAGGEAEKKKAKTEPKCPARSLTSRQTTSSSGSQKRPLPNRFNPPIKSHHSGSANCSTSAPMIMLPKQPPKTQLPEDKRKNTISRNSISIRIPNNQKMPSSVKQGKGSTPNDTKARSCTVSSPFRFRSDKRAEERKEFFKKLEEKNKNTEAAKEQLQSVSKTPRKRQRSSPRQCRNQSSCLKGNGTSFEHPLKATSVISTSTKNAVREKQRSSKNHPHCPLPKRKTRENISPNIQQ